MPLANGEEFAGYTVLELLGSGAMGEVYLAQHPRLPRRDAVKVLAATVSANDEFRQRFIREADLAATLYHPHIVGLHDRGECDGQLWLSMDYVDGTDAAALLSTRYPAGMPLSQVLPVITAVADALDHAAEHGLLHRDVKPANILIGTPDQSGRQRILLADFGIARPLSDPSSLTATSVAVGTIAYAAPEQLMGEHIDGRADQYALAATTFHLLTGRPPFQHDNPVAVIGQHLTAPVPKVSDLRRDLRTVDPIFTKALAKAPGDRFDDCRQFVHAITEASGGAVEHGSTMTAIPRASAAGPTDGANNIGKPLWRRRSVAFVAGCTTIAVAATAGVYVYRHHRATPTSLAAAHSTAAGPNIDGTYRIIFDYANSTYNGVPVPGKTDTVSYVWFVRSRCTDVGACTATAWEQDDPRAQQPPSDLANAPGKTQYELIDGQWKQRGGASFPYDPDRCLTLSGSIAPGRATQFRQRKLIPQPDGTLRGDSVTTEVAGECGQLGSTLEVPFQITRIADLPPSIATAPANLLDVPPITPTVPGPKLNGTYRLTFQNTEATMNGHPKPTTFDDEIWALQSTCIAAGCAAVGLQLDASGKPHQSGQSVPVAFVSRFSDGRWLQQPTPLASLTCSASGEEVVPGLVEVEVAVPRLRPAVW